MNKNQSMRNLEMFSQKRHNMFHYFVMEIVKTCRIHKVGPFSFPSKSIVVTRLIIHVCQSRFQGFFRILDLANPRQIKKTADL